MICPYCGSSDTEPADKLVQLDKEQMEEQKKTPHWCCWGCGCEFVLKQGVENNE